MSLWQREAENDPVILALTNLEMRMMFEDMVVGWFNQDASFNEFVSAMFKGDQRAMNHYMNRVTMNTFSFFDLGNKPSEASEPERFYHGFVLSPMADQSSVYILKSTVGASLGKRQIVRLHRN